MRKFVLIAAMAAAAASLALPASAQNARNYSFTGLFKDDNGVQFFDFTANGTSTVTLRSYSYAGGVNAAGQTIAAGGFDPILTLYDVATGKRIGYQDDGDPGTVPVDPVTGWPYDVSFSTMIAAGTYRVALSQYDNFGGPALAGAFANVSPTATQQYCDPGLIAPFCDASGAKRNGSWAFDILGVDAASQAGVPEPSTWAMMIAGFGMISGLMRRRARKRVLTIA